MPYVLDKGNFSSILKAGLSKAFDFIDQELLIAKMYA